MLIQKLELDRCERLKDDTEFTITTAFFFATHLQKTKVSLVSSLKFRNVDLKRIEPSWRTACRPSFILSR
jgi:hypothetical protein